MKVWGAWYGGSNYGNPDFTNREDVEEFESIAKAMYEFEDRYDNRSGQYPCVARSSTMGLYFEDPFMNHDPYPDRIISFGRRGGIKVERC